MYRRLETPSTPSSYQLDIYPEHCGKVVPKTAPDMHTVPGYLKFRDMHPSPATFEISSQDIMPCGKNIYIQLGHGWKMMLYMALHGHFVSMGPAQLRVSSYQSRIEDKL